MGCEVGGGKGLSRMAAKITASRSDDRRVVSPPERENAPFWSRFARFYETFIHVTTRNYPELVRRVAHEVGDARRVLDVGTGTGLMAFETSKRAGFVEAVDFAPGMIALARRKADELGVRNVRFSLQSAYALDFPDGSFDAVVASNVLHCMKMAERALGEIRRVLSPGGILVAPTFCHAGSHWTRVLSRLSMLVGFRPYRMLTTESLAGLIESCGFEVLTREEWKDVIPLAYVVARAV